MSQPADTTTIFQKLQDHTKKHDLNKIKKHIRYQPRTPTPPPKKRGGTSALSQHPVSPIHIITTQHTNMLCLKRIEQSTLLSSQTTHHTNNTTTHKHACSTIISRSSHDKSPQPTPTRITTRNEVLAAATHTTIHTHTHHRNPVGDEIEHSQKH